MSDIDAEMKNEKKAKTGKKKSYKLDFYKTLVLFALIPMVASIVITLVLMQSEYSKELEKITQEAMLSLVKETGAGFEYYIKNGEDGVRSFANSSIVLDYLKNTDNSQLHDKAKDYTLDYYNLMGTWEAIYIAKWDSTVLTHPVDAVIGKPTREGERLKALQDSMLASDGVYNVGVMVSPASGKNVVSMYAPVYDEKNNPVGFVGAAMYVSDVATMFSDTTSLDFPSLQVYTVNGNDSTIIQHKDSDKIGTVVEAKAIKDIISQMESGNEVTPGVIEYKEKGVNEYAAYYVGGNNDFIIVLSVKEGDVLDEVYNSIKFAIIIAIVLIIAFTALALYIARSVSTPLKKLAKFTQEISEGNINATIDAKSNIKETIMIIDSANTLKTTMGDIVSKINNSVGDLNKNMTNVDLSINDCMSAVDGVATAINGIAGGAMSMAESVQVTSDNMEIVGNNVSDIQSSVNNAKSNADNIQQISKEARTNLDKLMEANKHTIIISEDVVNGIEESNKAVEAINTTIDVITGIASQTDLLSLNASIEAARAGEAGKGFAVVAEEIKTLAEQSSQSVQEIKDIITNLVEKFSVSTELVEKIKESIAVEGEVLGNVKTSFDKVTTSIDLTSDNINDIYEITNELTTAKDKVLTEVSNLSAIAQENAASCQQTTASIESINSTIASISVSSKDTIALSKDLNEEIEFFKI